MKYKFYYDETEHSRIINLSTITAVNYYDSFVTSVLGWEEGFAKQIEERYLEFEKKYDYRKKNGELKSQTMKPKDLLLGFASLSKNNIGFYEDFLATIDENVVLYMSVFSKLEYVINQLFSNYHNTLVVDIDATKYSIVKLIDIYRPKSVLESMYEEGAVFVNELRTFIAKRIKENESNVELKARENAAIRQIQSILDDVEPPKSFNWDYCTTFWGLKKLIAEMGLDISDLQLFIDKEGEENKDSNTLKSAQIVGFANACEVNSRVCVGVRMADMFVGLFSRIMRRLKESVSYNYENCTEVKKLLLDSGWFALSQRQLKLYKELYRIVCVENNFWYKTYAGNYSDDLTLFVSFLKYINHFDSAEDIKKGLDMQPEYFNSFVCDALQIHYDRMKNKLAITPIVRNGKDFFYNQRGAKVYYDIDKQPKLQIGEGSRTYEVLSAGFDRGGTPLVTIVENGAPKCYVLPEGYSEWATMVVATTNMGVSLFPGEVVFSRLNGKYYADII